MKTKPPLSWYLWSRPKNRIKKFTKTNAPKVWDKLILNWIWILLAACLVLKWPMGVSLWSLTSIPICGVLLVLINRFIGPLRWITWPLYRVYFEKRASSVGGLMSLPAVLWVRFNGWPSYRKGGCLKLSYDLIAEMEARSNQLVQELRNLTT